jgi:hypothetical protein
VSVRIEAPYRANFLRTPIDLAALPADPVCSDSAEDPSWIGSTAGIGAGPLNVCRWDFEKPYEVPWQTACEFGFTPMLRWATPDVMPDFTTRIKMSQTSNITVLVKADGKFAMATKEIKVTLGGCGG